MEHTLNFYLRSFSLSCILSSVVLCGNAQMTPSDIQPCVNDITKCADGYAAKYTTQLVYDTSNNTCIADDPNVYGGYFQWPAGDLARYSQEFYYADSAFALTPSTCTCKTGC